MAARRLGVRSYAISDYEYANLTSFRRAGSTILFPKVIDSAVYQEAGFPSDRLIAFDGLKEDLTFAGVTSMQSEETTETAAPTRGRAYPRPPAGGDEPLLPAPLSPAVPGRPPLRRAGTSTPFSCSLRGIRVNERSRRSRPANPPIVLTHPVPFVSLLSTVDLVLCSGGTMLREAAFLGVPAYSLLASDLGEVDRHLEAIGRAVLISSRQDLSKIRLERLEAWSPISSNPDLVDELADLLVRQARRRIRPRA